MRLSTVFTVLVALGASSGSTAETRDSVLDQILSSARETVQRSQREGMIWNAVHEMHGSEAKAIVSYVVEPTRWFLKIDFDFGAHKQEVVRVIEIDGIWYVEDFLGRFKCRPYEAVLALPSLYHLIERGYLRLLDSSDEVSELEEYVSTSGEIAYFRTSLSSEDQDRIRSLIEYIDRVAQNTEADVQNLLARKKTFEDVLTRGVKTGINTKFGSLAEMGMPGQRIQIEDVDWISTDISKLFNVDDFEWEDRTNAVFSESEDLEDFVMISHCRHWQPDSEAPDTGSVLLNSKTGSISRIPYRNGICLSGCFSNDRQKVFVTGFSAITGLSTIVEIDLLTRENRNLLISKELRGIPMGITMSPDGQTLAVIDLAPGHYSGESEHFRGSLKSQIYLVDLATNRIRPLGRPMDMTSLSWMPNADSLLLMIRKHDSLTQSTREFIVRIDMNGMVTELLEGKNPQLILKGKRIAFRNKDDRHWYTCTIDGTDVKMLGDGLSKFGFPASSPRGDRLMMMKFGGAQGPKPHVIDASTGAIQSVEVGSGLWAMPKWR